MPNIQNKNRSNNIRIQNAGVTLAHNKVLKQVSSIINFITMMRYYTFASKMHVA